MKVSPKLKPAVFGAIGGAIALAIFGFVWGGWVTGGTAEKVAKERADTAVTAALTPVCVDKFRAGTDAAIHLAALKKISYVYEQGTYVEKGGWATMPGAAAPNADVARACAEVLSKSTP